MVRQFQLLFILAAFVCNNLHPAMSSPASYSFNGFSSGNNVNSFNYNTNTNTYTVNGQCVQEVTISGKGISDTFRLPCPQDGMDMLNVDNLLVIGDPKKNSICLFSDEPSSLVVIENGKCTKKTYTTRNGQTTNTWTPLSQAECGAVKRKIEVEQEKNRKEWEDWSKNFEQEMVNTFPPGFPFNQPSTGSQHNYDNFYENGSQPNSNGYENHHPGSSPGASGSNYGPGSSGVGSGAWWQAWNKNFAEKMSETMSQAFPPGFPFHNN